MHCSASACATDARASRTSATTQPTPVAWVTAAGTVYPTAHEPDECIGVTSGASVVLIDGTGKKVTLAVNASGNFTYTGSLQKPVKAAVVANGKTRAMSAPLDDGDCNACHTEKGTKNAPGRIMMP